MLFTKESPVLIRAMATVGVVVVLLLILVPCAVLFFAVNPDPAAQHVRLFRLPVACWAVWALVSLWAGLDSSRLWRVLGRPVDPLGTHAVGGMLLGALNIGASVLVVMLRTSR